MTSTVWVVVNHDDEDYYPGASTVLGVFTTEVAAHEWIDTADIPAILGLGRRRGDVVVEEHQLDVGGEGREAS